MVLSFCLIGKGEYVTVEAFALSDVTRFYLFLLLLSCSLGVRLTVVSTAMCKHSHLIFCITCMN